jgi:hypothetical protein
MRPANCAIWHGTGTTSASRSRVGWVAADCSGRHGLALDATAAAVPPARRRTGGIRYRPWSSKAAGATVGATRTGRPTFRPLSPEVCAGEQQWSRAYESRRSGPSRGRRRPTTGVVVRAVGAGTGPVTNRESPACRQAPERAIGARCLAYPGLLRRARDRRQVSSQTTPAHAASVPVCVRQQPWSVDWSIGTAEFERHRSLP